MHIVWTPDKQDCHFVVYAELEYIWVGKPRYLSVCVLHIQIIDYTM